MFLAFKNKKRFIHQVNCILVFLQDGSRLTSTDEPANERFLLRCLLVNGLKRCYIVCYFQSWEPLVRNSRKITLEALPCFVSFE